MTAQTREVGLHNMRTPLARGSPFTLGYYGFRRFLRLNSKSTCASQLGNIRVRSQRYESFSDDLLLASLPARCCRFLAFEWNLITHPENNISARTKQQTSEKQPKGLWHAQKRRSIRSIKDLDGDYAVLTGLINISFESGTSKEPRAKKCRG